MKVKVTHKFKDKYTEITHAKGEVLEITPERYEEIKSVGDFVFPITENEESEAHEDVSSDAFDEMSIRELKEYADKAYKLAFKNGMKKAEIIEELRRRENHG